MESKTLNTVTGGMLTLTGLSSWLTTLTYSDLGSIVTGGKMNSSGNVPFTETTVVGRMSGSVTQSG
jgi:hypothetical protein